MCSPLEQFGSYPEPVHTIDQGISLHPASCSRQIKCSCSVYKKMCLDTSILAKWLFILRQNQKELYAALNIFFFVLFSTVCKIN